MAFTTLAQLISDLDGMAVTGVVKSYGNPPQQISTAQIPLKFVAFPDTETPIISFASTGGLRAVSIELIILISPLLHNLTAANYDTSITLMDNLDAALRTNAASFGIDRWTMNMDTIQAGDANYWAIITNIFASG